MSFERKLPLLAAALIALVMPSAASAQPPSGEANATLLAEGLEGASGSTIGPDGALYVAEGATGKVLRVDPETGETTTFASGLPTWNEDIGFGGAVDVAFIGRTAYVLVTLLVGPDFEVRGDEVIGIYRVDGPDSFTVVADIGAFASENPPETDFFVPTGLQYALEPYPGHAGRWHGPPRRRFLVTDGHHNRLLGVTLDGEVSELIAFDNIVPAGLAVWGYTVFMAETGPVPHLPEDGKVVAFGPWLPVVTVASGAPLVVDVELGRRSWPPWLRRRTLYALSQGVWDGQFEGSPALPGTGALLKVNWDGTFTVITDGLDRPTSLEFIGNTAYVVTLAGEIWKIDDVSGPPYGPPR